MNGISSDSLIRRKENHLQTELGDETVVMHVVSGEIYGLASSAREIWARIAEPVRFDRLLADVMRDFEVAPDTCGTDVAEFLSELQRLDMIEIAREGSN